MVLLSTTYLKNNLAGDINKRLSSFGIKIHDSNGDDIDGMIKLSHQLITEIKNDNDHKLFM